MSGDWRRGGLIHNQGEVLVGGGEFRVWEGGEMKGEKDDEENCGMITDVVAPVSKRKEKGGEMDIEKVGGGGGERLIQRGKREQGTKKPGSPFSFKVCGGEGTSVHRVGAGKGFNG